MFTVNLDLSEVVKVSEELRPALERACKKAAAELTAMTRAHIIEEANKKLHTRREMFIENLTHMQVDENTWVVNLDAKAVWIDEGTSPRDMLDDFLKSPKAKRAKDGSTYLTIPFEHGPKGSTQMTPAQATLLSTIKTELQKRKIPYAKIEKDVAGNAKLGKLHSFDITKEPIKNGQSKGQGAGPVGEVMQGPTGIPLLKGISIYQQKVKDKKTGKEKVKRSIMTFRVASSKHEGQGRWDHPGLEATHLMEEGAKWATEQWEKYIAPKLIAELATS